ncbi:MAG: glycosyltransferase family 1 protein [Candidatus Moranbacteria bacterium]|nr:glycosyltransferase family 1 protein [Candidatus Moranbacteria bacterium]
MTIGIDASRAFVKNKTGIEEYSYQVIKNLKNFLAGEKIILYLDPRVNREEHIDFDLPENWSVKFLQSPKFWTQIRLSIEMIFHRPDVLFVPAHTVPLIHPKDTIVTVHGLEYEFCPEAYSPFERFYMRWSIMRSCRWVSRIIAVSENTKKDLMRLYRVPEEKIKVVYEGINENLKSIPDNKIISHKKYLLFVGRLEERKNIIRMVEAFEMLKKKYAIPHKLILVGKFGYGGEKIEERIKSSEFKNDIILTGYVGDEEKFYLLAGAEVFLFATIYEGFGLPILEAQNVGVPVVTSNISSMPEVAGDSAVLVDPMHSGAIAEGIWRLVGDEKFKNGIIEKGFENVKRFSWEKCAREVSDIIQIRE